MSEEQPIFKGQQAEKASQENSAPQASGFGRKNQPNGLPEGVETVVITFDKVNGNLQIAGKIEDKILMYGILEGAKDLVQQYNDLKYKPVPEKIIE